MLAGGAALTTHATKAGTRLLANHSPEPVSNIALSVGEDAAVVGGSALAFLAPITAFFFFAALLVVLWLVLPRVWRTIRGSARFLFRKMKAGAEANPSLP